MKQNENYTDRLIRLFIAIVLFVLWRFWLWWNIQYIFLILSWILLITSIFWICPFYYLVKLNTKKFKNFSKRINIIVFILLMLILWGLIYLSIFFTTKFFIEDYNDVNNSYKQLLFNTWKEKREESIRYYEELAPKLQNFENKYLNYKPYKLKSDKDFDSDLLKIDSIIKELKSSIYTWDLAETHIKLEWVRTILQDILKRNWFSLSWIALVDFHDVMEILIDASDKKDSETIINTYELASEKLQIVEWYLNDDWVKNIRKELDKLLELAQNNQSNELQKQASELKSSFIKVYLSNN